MCCFWRDLKEENEQVKSTNKTDKELQTSWQEENVKATNSIPIEATQNFETAHLTCSDLPFTSKHMNFLKVLNSYRLFFLWYFYLNWNWF